jgi:hypothetical protein
MCKENYISTELVIRGYNVKVTYNKEKDIITTDIDLETGQLATSDELMKIYEMVDRYLENEGIIENIVK